MLADSQFIPRLTYNASVIYGRLYRRLGEVVTHAELCSTLYVSKYSIIHYVRQIRRNVPNVDVVSVPKVGYMMVEKHENA